MLSGIFMDTFLVLLLSGVAGVILSGVMLGRKMLRLAGARTDEQAARAEGARDLARHQMAVSDYNQTQALLQLTAGPKPEKPKPAVKEEEVDDEVEEAKPRKRDIHVPWLGVQKRAGTKGENADVGYKDIADAPEGEWTS